MPDAVFAGVARIHFAKLNRFNHGDTGSC